MIETQSYVIRGGKYIEKQNSTMKKHQGDGLIWEHNGYKVVKKYIELPTLNK